MIRGWKMKNRRMKYFSFDKIPYLYDSVDEDMLPFNGSISLDPDLKIAG